MSYTYSYPVTSRRNTYSDYQTARRPKSIVVYPHATVVQPPSPRIIHTSPRKDGKHKRSRKSSVVIQEAPREHLLCPTSRHRSRDYDDRYVYAAPPVIEYARSAHRHSSPERYYDIAPKRIEPKIIYVEPRSSTTRKSSQARDYDRSSYVSSNSRRRSETTSYYPKEKHVSFARGWEVVV